MDCAELIEGDSHIVALKRILKLVDIGKSFWLNLGAFIRLVHVLAHLPVEANLVLEHTKEVQCRDEFHICQT